MRKQIEELKRKSEQGSQQAQGEAMEVEIENLLGERFPLDSIEPIAKGQRGADILLGIRTQRGEEAGSILYESKNTKNWSDSWIQKAKDDQREKRAELVVIVTESLPKDINGFGFLDGVWVTNFRNYLSLSEALRIHLIEIFHARNAATGKGEKLDCLYRYMSETQFKQRIEAIVEGFRALRESLDGEKRAMQRIWSAREKCLERVISNTAGMYGDVQGIIGTSLPKIELLELENVPLLEAPENDE